MACLWSEALVTVRTAEPRHMKTTLTCSIGEHVSEVSSGSFRMGLSVSSRHSQNFIVVLALVLVMQRKQPILGNIPKSI